MIDSFSTDLVLQYLPYLTSVLSPRIQAAFGKCLEETVAVGGVELVRHGAKVGFEGIKDQLLQYASKENKPPENHDLQRAFYASFLNATDVIFQVRLRELGSSLEISSMEGLRRRILDSFTGSKLLSLPPVFEGEKEALSRKENELAVEILNCAGLSAIEIQERMPLRPTMDYLTSLTKEVMERKTPLATKVIVASILESHWYEGVGERVKDLVSVHLWEYMSAFFAEEIKTNERVERILVSEMLADIHGQTTEVRVILKESIVPSLEEIQNTLTALQVTKGSHPSAKTSEKVEDPIPPEIQADLDRAKSLTDADKHSEAIPILEQALAVADLSGHAEARVKVRLSLAAALYEARENSLEAERHYRDALGLVPIGNLDLKHKALHGLGDMLLFSGQLDKARATIDASLDVARVTSKADYLAGSLISLSLLNRALGFQDRSMANIDEAVNLLLQQALTISEREKKHNAFQLAVCYINKAFLFRDAGDLDEALALYSRVEEQHRISGDKLDAGKALLFCGEVHCTNADWEKGLDCFWRALESFKEIVNWLWGARALEHISRLFATHERWEEALQAMIGAAAGAEQSKHPGEQVHFLCLAAKLLGEWKTKAGRENIGRMIHTIVKDIPEEKQSEMMPGISQKMSEMSDAMEKVVREDDQVRDLLKQAKDIAQREHLHEHLANCLLDEAHHMVPPDDTKARRELISQAIELLRVELREVQFAKRRGHLMGRISALYRELGESPESLSWLKKAGEVFEKSGDAFGLANFQGSLAEIYRAEGRLDEEMAAYRKILSIVEGRSFHDLAAGTRINLAAALRDRREFGDAQKLLNEAEVLCDRHHLKGFISAIARNRHDIEKELQAAQAPTHTLPQILRSLDELFRYRPQDAVAYLPFWYFAWNTELLAALRSGPHLSFMVVSDDVERFMKFTVKFQHLADHFVLATTSAPKIKVEVGVLAIPPEWRFPASFCFVGVRRKRPEPRGTEPESWRIEQEGDAPPEIRLEGPANILPFYTLIKAESAVKGEGHVAALSATYLPQEAIDLMVRRPTEELIRLRALWLPVDRFNSKDTFLTDLRIGHERGVFPVYFDRLPTSDAVAVCGAVRISIPSTLLSGDHSAAAAKWSRALLRLTKLPKEEAQVALLDLPEAFADVKEQGGSFIQIEIHLFEFSEINRRLSHPVLLVRG